MTDVLRVLIVIILNRLNPIGDITSHFEGANGIVEVERTLASVCTPIHLTFVCINVMYLLKPLHSQDLLYHLVVLFFIQIFEDFHPVIAYNPFTLGILPVLSNYAVCCR